MKDISRELVPANYAKLNGNIQLAGVSVPVFESFVYAGLNTTGDYRFIELKSVSTSPRFNKCNFEGDALATIEVCCAYLETRDFGEADDIADEVLQLLIPFHISGAYDLDSFDISNVNLISSDHLTDYTDTHYEYRKILRINYTYSQNITA